MEILGCYNWNFISPFGSLISMFMLALCIVNGLESSQIEYNLSQLKSFHIIFYPSALSYNVSKFDSIWCKYVEFEAMLNMKIADDKQ